MHPTRSHFPRGSKPAATRRSMSEFFTPKHEGGHLHTYTIPVFNLSLDLGNPIQCMDSLCSNDLEKEDFIWQAQTFGRGLPAFEPIVMLPHFQLRTGHTSLSTEIKISFYCIGRLVQLVDHQSVPPSRSVKTGFQHVWTQFDKASKPRTGNRHQFEARTLEKDL